MGMDSGLALRGPRNDSSLPHTAVKAAQAGIQYAAASWLSRWRLWNTA